MFEVIQYLDQTAALLSQPIKRTVCGVDRASDSFLVANEVGNFLWIPIWACRLYEKDKE